MSRLEQTESYFIFSSLSAQINLPQFIKILHFQGGGQLKFFLIFVIKAPESGLLGKKSGGLFEFCIGGGLIKSGGFRLFAWIRYTGW